MKSVDFYRAKANELRARALQESNPDIQAELEGIAAAYIRLAEQADRNDTLDISYERQPRAEPKDAPD